MRLDLIGPGEGFLAPCEYGSETITIDNQHDATILIYLL